MKECCEPNEEKNNKCKKPVFRMVVADMTRRKTGHGHGHKHEKVKEEKPRHGWC